MSYGLRSRSPARGAAWLACAIMLAMPPSAAQPATMTVSFSVVTGRQAMGWGTNEIPGHIRPSWVAVDRLRQIESRCSRYWVGGDIWPSCGYWDWAYLDEGVDKLVQAGVTPMICFAGIPDCMAETPHPGEPDTWNHPRDLNEWADYCITIVQHCAARGRPVESWYWEIWNEPNNGGVSGGWSVAEYLELYDAAAAALRAAYPNIRIGGPSTDHASEHWIVPLLAHDVQFITWHRYGAWDPHFTKPTADYLAETSLYGSSAAAVEAWIAQHRPGEDILNVCGELNLNAAVEPGYGVDDRIWQDMMIPWYASSLRHLLLNGCDFEQFFVGTDKSWPGFGLFIGTGTDEGRTSPAFEAKRLFAAAAPTGCDLVWSDVAGPSTLEVLATRDVRGRHAAVLINKTTDSTPVTLELHDLPVPAGIWYTVDQASYDAGGISTQVAAGGSVQSTTLDGYAMKVFDVCDAAADCVPDADSDGVLRILDNCPDTYNANQYDVDGDGWGDACDECPATPRGDHGTATGCPTPRADFDLDRDVDQEDFGHLQACLSGAGVAQEDVDCLDARLDEDLDVDQDDMALLRGCLSAPDTPADLQCMG